MSTLLVNSQIADTLDKAADLIFVNGWTQHAYELPTGALCATGAIAKALKRDPLQMYSIDWHYAWPDVCQVYNVMSTYLGHEEGFLGVVYYNDCAAKNADEIIDALKGCAKSLREIEAP